MNPTSNRSFFRSTSALLVVGLVALLGIVGMTYWLGQRAQVYFDEVIAARDARGAAVELRNAVQSAESSQRGFLYTGNEIYLAPYDTAKTLANRQFEAFKRDFVAYPELAASVRRLTTILGEKFDEMDQTIELKRTRRDDEALATFRTNRGKALMDEANVHFSGAILAADGRLTTSATEHRENARWLRWFTIVGGIVIIAVVGAAAAAVVRYTRELRQARDAVDVLNAGLEQRVQDRTARLTQMNEEVQRFAYIVTHDLRAPLVNIMGFTSELEGGLQTLQAAIDKPDMGSSAADQIARDARIAATEDLPEAIGFIRSSTKKMDNLINAILRISREGRRLLRPEALDLGEVIGSSVDGIRHRLAEASGTIDVELGVKAIVSDRQSIDHVVGNVLDNAVKYRASGRPLQVGVKTMAMAGGRIAIEIKDNGRGIAEQDLERVFELFRRAGAQDQPGEGIGLAYARTVVRNMGGDMTVTSVLDQGTTFRIVLPAVLQLPESAAA